MIPNTEVGAARTPGRRADVTPRRPSRWALIFVASVCLKSGERERERARDVAFSPARKRDLAACSRTWTRGCGCARSSRARRGARCAPRPSQRSCPSCDTARAEHHLVDVFFLLSQILAPFFFFSYSFKTLAGSTAHASRRIDGRRRSTSNPSSSASAARARRTRQRTARCTV